MTRNEKAAQRLNTLGHRLAKKHPGAPIQECMARAAAACGYERKYDILQRQGTAARVRIVGDYLGFEAA